MKDWWSDLKENGTITMLGFMLVLAATIVMTWLTILLALWIDGRMLIWGMWSVIAFLSYMVWALNKECRKLEAVAYPRIDPAKSSMPAN